MKLIESFIKKKEKKEQLAPGAWASRPKSYWQCQPSFYPSRVNCTHVIYTKLLKKAI